MLPLGSRSLKLAFAMGGGVSLGAFQGAALTQALKIALAHASYVADETDAHETPNQRYLYRNVQLDALSGASAGALSLVLLLASLLDASPADEFAALRALEADPAIGPTTLATLPPNRRKRLIAAQRAQDLQRQVWTSDIGIERLTFAGRSISDEDRTATPSLLDRDALAQIARERIPAPLGSSPLLASRVLFACTLTNLTPMIASGIAAKDPTAPALRDAMRSNVHRELRVFDLALTADPRPDAPRRWRPFSLPADAPAALAELTQTAIACAAFPFAFEPVTLTRYRHEFIAEEWDVALGPDVESHPFVYIDGGTFNNEPIREAFRLASYLDSHLLADRRTDSFDRRVIFVSPNTSDERQDFTVPVLRQYALKPGPLHPEIYRLPALDRLVPHVSTLLGALLDQARCNEEDKIAQTRARFGNRDQRRAFLRRALVTDPSPDLFPPLLSDIQRMLTQAAQTAAIPVTPLGLPGELRRVIWEEVGRTLTLAEAHELAEKAAVWGNLEDSGEFWRQQNSAFRGFWLYLLTIIGLDLSLDLAGKESGASIVGIAPFHLSENAATPLPMPASAFIAFAGFLSASAAAHAFETGAFATHNFLAAAKLIDAPLLPPSLIPACDPSYRQEMQTRAPALANRLKEFVTSTRLIDFPFAGVVKSAVADLAAKAIATKLDSDLAALASASPPRTFELRVFVPSPDLKFARPGFDMPALLLSDGRRALITFATCSNGSWSFAHTSDPTLAVHWTGIAETLFCTIDPPDPAAIDACNRMPWGVLELSLATLDQGARVPASRWKCPL